MPGPKYWLMKSEPSVYSIDHLKKDHQTSWEGVRNYQARNFMRDDMKVGELVLFYHSNANPTGIAGLARICRQAYADDAAWDPKSRYFDAKSSPENPRWFMVDVAFSKKFPQIISLEQLRQEKSLKDMLVLKRGMRLSVQPVDKKHFDQIVKMAEKKAR